MTVSAAAYLGVYLEPLAEMLDRPDVSDIYVNKTGEIWIETLGGAIERHPLPELTEPHLHRLARQVANISHQGISRERPLLAARLPDGSRIQIVAPPATRGPLALAIRKHVSADLALSDLEGAGAFELTHSSAANERSADLLDATYRQADWRAFLVAAVRARQTILVSGGTSTGKTTFLNALLREIPPEERLILIEDTPELVLRHDNAVGLVAVRGDLGEAQVTPDDLLMASLRMRPDRIILGELRGNEAFIFLKAANTGHPGSMTTIHADSPGRAIDQLALLVLQASAGLHRNDVIEHIRRTIDVVVQLDRTGGRRRVANVTRTADLPG